MNKILAYIRIFNKLNEIFGCKNNQYDQSNMWRQEWLVHCLLGLPPTRIIITGWLQRGHFCVSGLRIATADGVELSPVLWLFTNTLGADSGFILALCAVTPDCCDGVCWTLILTLFDPQQAISPPLKEYQIRVYPVAKVFPCRKSYVMRRKFKHDLFTIY